MVSLRSFFITFLIALLIFGVCAFFITGFVTDAFVGYGIPREDAEICADVLLESDKRGIESHGCNRFKPVFFRVTTSPKRPKHP